MSNRRLEDVILTCILNHYILKTSSKRTSDRKQTECRWANTLKNTSSRCKHYIK